ncbi:MAG: GNAT family N-acetyltransferase [Collinsella sp.]
MDGKAALAALDIPQWLGDYPNHLDIEADMAEDASYVAVGEDGTVLAVMALSFSGEETYDQIDGAWLTESDSREPRYAVIHRCAISAAAARRGIMTLMFEEGERIAREHGSQSIRVDTHERNIPVQGLVSKLGYTHCGTITLPYPGGSRSFAHRIREGPLTYGAPRRSKAPRHRRAPSLPFMRSGNACATIFGRL